MAPPPIPHRSTFSSDHRNDSMDALSQSGRSLSTSQRLFHEGFREQQQSTSSSQTTSTPHFAVRSIRRGEWNHLLKLFVADLAFRSVVTRRFQSDVSFQPYTCSSAAVLFVDLCQYSRIAAAVSHHALSTTVNDYLDKLLALVDVHGGDVVKFAGDAVLVVWEGTNASDMEINVLTAAKCVLEMQKHAGSHPVEGTNLHFRIHCGLSCGHLESEVFAAPVHENMQRLYHSVGGDSVVEIGELVDLAQPGEVCVSGDVVNLLGTRGLFRDVREVALDGSKILIDLKLEESSLEKIDVHIFDLKTTRSALRNRSVEEEFIHPMVKRLLRYGGHSPTQISQMRNLCVLFIAMTSNGSSVNWLMEVQSILDKNRCPSKFELDYKYVVLVRYKTKLCFTYTYTFNRMFSPSRSDHRR